LRQRKRSKLSEVALIMSLGCNASSGAEPVADKR
jgi:hypothetical protein